MEEMDAQKLRGGFYTPERVVDACWDRVGALLNGTRNIKILEPSAGDGAFVRGLGRLRTNSRLRQSEITCIEILESEWENCARELERANLRGDVFRQSFFNWMSVERGPFNTLVGNPPFVRYQFVPEADRLAAELLLQTRGHDLSGLSNYWIAFVLLGLDLLQPGGVFSMVLPSELLSTISGGQVRAELVRKFDSLRIDLYPRNTFPDILQDVLVVSGVRAKAAAKNRLITFTEHGAGTVREWEHDVTASGESWTRFLLSPSELESFNEAKRLRGFYPLGSVAPISVAIVTGANDYFTVDDATVEKYELSQWALPLLARSAESPGLLFSQRDFDAARRSGKRCWLLNFSETNADPTKFPMAAKYLAEGESRGLHLRYKCRIRTPWYRVPYINSGKLMMSKRSHQHHRLILNQAAVYTTDTIYRGDMTAEHHSREHDLVAGFHNSATMLAAEVEGRTYGGGVLELVPSEISRLCVPLVDMTASLEKLDRISRSTGGQRDVDDTLIDATDALLATHVPGFAKLVPALAGARNRLRDRRFTGNMEG